MTHRPSFLALVAAAAMTLPASALARAPSKSEIDASVAALPAESTDGVRRAQSELQTASALYEADKTALAARRLRYDAAKLRHSQATVELQALEADLAAAGLLNDLAEKESLAVHRARAQATAEWRQSEVDAAKLDVQHRTALVNRDKALVAQREAELDREKLSALAASTDDPDTHKAAGSAYKIGARKRQATARLEKKVGKAEKEWRRAEKVAERQHPKEGGDALQAAHKRALAERDAQVAEAHAQVDAERAQTATLRARVDELEADRATRSSELEQRISALSALADSREAERATQLAEERARHDAELAALRAEAGKEGGLNASRELAASAVDLSAARLREQELAAQLKTAATERDAARAEAAALSVAVQSAQLEGGAEAAARKDQLAQARRDHALALADAQQARDGALAERDALVTRVGALEAEIVAARQATPAPDDRGLRDLVASLKRQLALATANADERSQLLERQLDTQARKHEARVEELAATLEAARDEADGLVLRIAAEEDDRVAVLSELERTKAQRDEQAAQVSALDGRLAAQKSEFEKRVDELTAAVAGASAKDKELAGLQAELDATRASLATSMSEGKAATAKAQDGAAQVAKLTSQVTSLEAAQSKARTALEAARDDAATALAELALELTASREEVVALRVEVDAASGQIEALRARHLRELTDAASAATAAAGTDEEARNEMALTLAIAESRRDELQGQLESLRFAQRALQREFAEIEGERDAAIARAQAGEEKQVTLAGRLREIEQGGKERGASLNASLSAARAELVAQREQLAALEQQLLDRDRVVARLQAENKAIWARIDGR